MPAVSKITIHVGASTAALTRGFNQAGAKTKQFGNSFKALGSQLRAFNPLLSQLGGNLGAMSSAISMGPIGAAVAALLAGTFAAKKFFDVLRHGFEVAKDAPQIKAAAAAVKQMQTAFDAIAGTLAIQFAPLIFELANSITAITKEFAKWQPLYDMQIQQLLLMVALWKAQIQLIAAAGNALRGNFAAAFINLSEADPFKILEDMRERFKRATDAFAKNPALLTAIKTPGPIAAVTRDTVAGFQAEQAARRAQLGGMKNIPAEQLAEQKRTNQKLDQLHEDMRGGGPQLLPVGL